MMKVSLFASAIRSKLWAELFLSLEGTSVEYEVIFAGNAKIQEMFLFQDYIPTANIKPAQCYEIARRNCTGEVVVWMADDCEFKGNIIGKAYDYWKAQANEKLILSLQTEESKIWQNMNYHRFFGGDDNGTPLMAPIGMASRAFIEELGGLDRRYVCGQYENDLVMRAMLAGGKVEIFGDKSSYVEINHHEKSISSGETTQKQEYERRPFASGYGIDRSVLQKSWCKLNETKLFMAVKNGQTTVFHKDIHDILPQRADDFEPFAKDISLTVSESNKGIWE